MDKLKANLARAQNYLKQKSDVKRRDVQFQVGDLVLIKLQPYRQQTFTLRKNQKLRMRYFGPFCILQKIAAVAYRLELPEIARIHLIFHVSLLKRFKGDSATPYMPLPLQIELEGPILQPFQVLASRTIVKESLSIPQVLIQWENTEPHEAT